MQTADVSAGSAGLAIGSQASHFTGFTLSFGKQSRLLTAREFKAVFDNALYKASHRSLLLLAIPRQPDITAPARLGLVVAKKHTKLAVQRNRLKRQLRESFRHHQHELTGLDIVALTKPGLWQMEAPAIRVIIEEQWTRLLQQKKRQAS